MAMQLLEVGHEMRLRCGSAVTGSVSVSALQLEPSKCQAARVPLVAPMATQFVAVAQARSCSVDGRVRSRPALAVTSPTIELARVSVFALTPKQRVGVPLPQAKLHQPVLKNNGEVDPPVTAVPFQEASWKSGLGRVETWQAVADWQLTRSRAEVRLVVVTSAQLVPPVHLAAHGPIEALKPTARQNAVDEHDTPVAWTVGVGRVRETKVEPFHRRATDPLSFWPTTTQVVDEGHEIDSGA